MFREKSTALKLRFEVYKAVKFYGVLMRSMTPYCVSRFGRAYYLHLHIHFKEIVCCTGVSCNLVVNEQQSVVRMALCHGVGC